MAQLHFRIATIKKTLLETVSSIYLFRIPVEEQVAHDSPFLIARDGSPQSEDLTSEHPQHQANGMWRLKQ